MATGISKDQFVEGMRLFPAAVNLICCGSGEDRIGFTATAAMSLTAEPAQLALAIGRNVSAFERITSGNSFTINTLASNHIELAGNFAGKLKGSERFGTGTWTDTPFGPKLEGALLTFECTIADRVELSSHVLLIADVKEVHRDPQLNPLLYVDGDWAGLMPLSAKEADSYLEPVRDSIAAIERATNAGGTYVQQIARFIAYFTDVYIKRQSESRDYFAVELYVRQDHLEEINRHKRDFDHRLTALLEEGRRAGAFNFDDARLTALAITGMVGWTHRWFRPDGRMKQAEVEHQLARLTLRMLGVEVDQTAINSDANSASLKGEKT